jgi:hypothetical protein
MIHPALAGLRLALAPFRRRFERALRHPREAQRRVLDALAAELARTEYGRRHGVRTTDDALRLPVMDAEAYRPWLERQRERGGPVITAEEVVCYEPTSGSSGPVKYIPYTRALRRSFSRMFCVWAHDVLRSGPTLRTGRTYISVSPSLAPAGGGGPRAGMHDDRDYLDRWLRRLIDPFWVGPRALAPGISAERFRAQVCEALLAEPRLEIVSVWSPSFLTALLEHISGHREALAGAAGLGGERRAGLFADPIDWGRVWPELKLISCWASGQAAPQARRLADEFPAAMIQGKGLLSTEGPVTVPILEAGGYVPLLGEVYLELEDAGGALGSVLDGAVGATYELVLGQRGGLFRYKLGDRVRLTHRFRGVPCLEFVGRAGGCSDLVGEKLEESFVERALEALGQGPTFTAILVPVREPRPRYVLVCDGGPGDLAELGARLERELRRAYHYNLARELEQLEAVQVVSRPGARQVLVEAQSRRGARLGDVKERALLPQPADAALLAALTEHAGSVE